MAKAPESTSPPADLQMEIELERHELSITDELDRITPARLYYIKYWTFNSMRYGLFVAVFTIVSFTNSPGEEGYWFSAALKNAYLDEEFPDIQILKTFTDIGQIDEFFQWYKGVFLEALYTTEEYNGDAVPKDQQSALRYYNRLVGGARIRQMRVKPNTCKILDQFSFIIHDCYGSYGSDTRDTADFTPGNVTYTYTTESGAPYLAQVFQYSALGGYTVDIPSDPDDAMAQALRLEAERWIDEQTRAIFVELAYYNPAVDLFCVMRLTVEFPPGGGLVPYYTFRTMRLSRYSTKLDYFVLAMELLLVILVIWDISTEVKEMVTACRRKGKNLKRGWKAYFIDDTWNYMSLLILTLFCAVIALRIYWVLLARDIMDNPTLKTGTGYLDLQSAAYIQQQELNIASITMLFVWLGLFKYLRQAPGIGLLVKVLQVGSGEILLFGLTFFFVFLGYGLSGYMLFSLDLREFSTMGQTMATLLQYVIGNFNYAAIYASNRVLGPIYFFSYMLLVFLVLLNVFIAIVSNAYTFVQEEEEENIIIKRKDEKLRKFLGETRDTTCRGRIIWYWRLMKRAWKTKDPANNVGTGALGMMEQIDLNNDGILDRQELQRYFGNVDALLSKYDIDNSLGLDETELLQWFDDLQEEKERLEYRLSAMIDEEELGHSDWGRQRKLGLMRERIMKHLKDYHRRVAKMIKGHSSTFLDLHYKPAKMRVADMLSHQQEDLKGLVPVPTEEQPKEETAGSGHALSAADKASAEALYAMLHEQSTVLGHIARQVGHMDVRLKALETNIHGESPGVFPTAPSERARMGQSAPAVRVPSTLNELDDPGTLPKHYYHHTDSD